MAEKSIHSTVQQHVLLCDYVIAIHILVPTSTMAPRSKRTSASTESTSKRAKPNQSITLSKKSTQLDEDKIKSLFELADNEPLQYTDIYRQQQLMLQTHHATLSDKRLLKKLYYYRTPSSLNNYHVSHHSHGQLYSFGSGDMAQLGLGDDENMRERKKPTHIKTLSDHNIVSLTCGALHNACITSNGAVYTWGCNDDNALGRTGTADDDTAEWLPAPVDGVLGKGITSTNHSISDSVESERVVQIHAGASHTIALTSNGSVYTFGTYRDANGVLGFTTTMNTATTPYYMQSLSESNYIIQIAAGEHHDLALTSTGDVYQWGDIGLGQRISDRRKLQKLLPQRVSFAHIKPTVPHIIGIYAGGHSSFAIDSEFNVYAWGPNNYGQCGVVISNKMKSSGDYILHQPTLINTKSQCGNIIKIAANIHHTLLLNSAGKVYALGRSDYGRLGTGNIVTSQQQHSDQPVLVHIINELPDNQYIVDISCGEGHSTFVTNVGDLYTCGSGELCQLGLSEEEDVYVPTLVQGKQLENKRVVQCSAGSQHTVVLAAAEKTSPQTLTSHHNNVAGK